MSNNKFIIGTFNNFHISLLTERLIINLRVFIYVTIFHIDLRVFLYWKMIWDDNGKVSKRVIKKNICYVGESTQNHQACSWLNLAYVSGYLRFICEILIISHDSE